MFWFRNERRTIIDKINNRRVRNKFKHNRKRKGINQMIYLFIFISGVYYTYFFDEAYKRKTVLF